MRTCSIVFIEPCPLFDIDATYSIMKPYGECMSRADKRLQKMRQNPRDWRIEEIQSIADSLGIEWRHDGGSHVIFRSPSGEHLSMPAHRPIKPIYISKFLVLVSLKKEAENERSEE